MVGSYGPFSDGHYEDSRLGFGTKVVVAARQVYCLINTHGFACCKHQAPANQCRTKNNVK